MISSPPGSPSSSRPGDGPALARANQGMGGRPPRAGDRLAVRSLGLGGKRNRSSLCGLLHAGDRSPACPARGCGRQELGYRLHHLPGSALPALVTGTHNQPERNGAPPWAPGPVLVWPVRQPYPGTRRTWTQPARCTGTVLSEPPPNVRACASGSDRNGRTVSARTGRAGHRVPAPPRVSGTTAGICASQPGVETMRSGWTGAGLPVPAAGSGRCGLRRPPGSCRGPDLDRTVGRPQRDPIFAVAVTAWPPTLGLASAQALQHEELCGDQENPLARERPADAGRDQRRPSGNRRPVRQGLRGRSPSNPFAEGSDCRTWP